MKQILIMSVVIAFGMISGLALANGYGEDSAWQFESSNSKYVKLQMRATEEVLDADGFGPGNSYTDITVEDGGTLHVGDNVDGDKITPNNCINCSSVSVEVGDNVSGNVDVEVTQSSKKATQVTGVVNADLNDGFYGGSVADGGTLHVGDNVDGEPVVVDAPVSGGY